MRAKTNQQAKPVSLALPWRSDPLLDDLAVKISIDQTALCLGDGRKAGIRYAILFAKRSGLENTHK